MAKLVSRVLSFVPSTDAVSYNVYKHDSGTEPSYEGAHENVTATAGADGRVAIDLATLVLFKDFEGTCDVGVTALDAIGNESDFLDIDAVVFDFSPPAAPTDGRVE